MAAILDKIEDFSVKQRAIAAAVLLVAFLGVFYQYVYKPKTAEITRVTAQLSEVNSELQDLRAIQKKLGEFKGMVVELEAQLVEAQEQLPRKRDIPTLLNDISEMGRESGLEFQSFRPAAEQVQGFYAVVPINLKIEGPFHSVVTFLDKISHYPRIIKVLTFDLAPSSRSAKDDEEGKPLMLRSSVKAATYRYLEQQ